MEQEKFVLTENPEKDIEYEQNEYKGHIYCILSYSIPILISQVCKPLIRVIDITVLSAHAGHDISILYICEPLTTFLPETLGNIIFYSLITLCSRCYSCGDFEKFFDTHKAGLHLSTFFAIIYTTITLSLSKLIFSRASVISPMDYSSKLYFYIAIGAGVLPSLWAKCLNAVLISTKHQYIAFIGMMLELLVLIFGSTIPVKFFNFSIAASRCISGPLGSIVNIIFCSIVIYMSRSVGSCLLPNFQGLFKKSKEYKNVLKFGLIGIPANLGSVISIIISKEIARKLEKTPSESVKAILGSFESIALLEAVPSAICSGFCIAMLSRASHEFYHNKKQLFIKLIKFSYASTSLIMLISAMIMTALNKQIPRNYFRGRYDENILGMEMFSTSLIIALPMQAISGGIVLSPFILQVLNMPIAAFVTSLVPGLVTLLSSIFGLSRLYRAPYTIIWTYPITDIIATICVHFVMLLKVTKKNFVTRKKTES